jgi:hypothetical protein
MIRRVEPSDLAHCTVCCGPLTLAITVSPLATAATLIVQRCQTCFAAGWPNVIKTVYPVTDAHPIYGELDGDD